MLGEFVSTRTVEVSHVADLQTIGTRRQNVPEAAVRQAGFDIAQGVLQLLQALENRRVDYVKPGAHDAVLDDLTLVIRQNGQTLAINLPKC